MFDGVLGSGTPVAFTPESGASAHARSKLAASLSPLELALRQPLIDEINALKAKAGAVILAHNYMTPEIFHGVGDFVGDSLALAKEAARCDAKP